MFRALHEQEQTPPDEADASEGTVLAADAGATSEPTADVPSLGLSGNGERAPALMNLAPGASFTATLGNHTTQARRLFAPAPPPLVWTRTTTQARYFLPGQRQAEHFLRRLARIPPREADLAAAARRREQADRPSRVSSCVRVFG